jgi:undecaprenyl diphosphate synthase
MGAKDLPDSPDAGCLDPASIPCHVGIIMDGNGRWAQARNKPRTSGHREGLDASKRIVRAAARIGIRYLSLYTFSTENWKRTSDEVGFLMNLIKTHLRSEYDFYRENRVRIVHTGDLGRLPKDVQAEIRQASQDTAGFEGLTVNLAINYGGRDEIVRSVQRCLAEGITAPTEADISAHLDEPEIPDADLIVRTGGEVRLSNWLLWRSAYAELVFSDKYWPDWVESDLIQAVRSFQQRQRRFGGTK